MSQVRVADPTLSTAADRDAPRVLRDADIIPVSTTPRAAFIDWLLGLPDTAAFVVETESGQAHVGPAVRRLLPPADGRDLTSLLAATLGHLSLDGELLRRATVVMGPGLNSAPAQLWVAVPIESEEGEVLLVGLYIAPLAGAAAADQEAGFQAALAEPERRHAINQPLTALSFLLENLLHAFLTGLPDGGYQARKAGDLLQQLVQLRQLLPVAEGGR